MEHSTAKRSSRERICEAALSAFAKHGFDGVGVTKIASDAGVSQPTIHYHFKTKRALWEAAMMQLGVSLERTRSVQNELYGFLPPLEKLKATCALLIEDAATRPVLGQIILSEGQAGGKRLEWLLRHVLSDTYYEFQETIEACIRGGLIKPYQPAQILMLLTGAAVTQFNVSPLVAAVFGDNPHARQNVDAFKAMYLDIIFTGLIVNKEE